MFTKKFKLNEVPELEGKNIIDKKKLSESFGMITEKILFDNNKSYISKSCMENNKKFNSIISEAKSLEYMYNLFPKFFPRVIFYQSNILVMDFIEHDNKKNETARKINKIIALKPNTNTNARDTEKITIMLVVINRIGLIT